MAIMNGLESSFIATLYRPYFDLGPTPPESILPIFALENDYQNLSKKTSHPQFQAMIHPSYRDAIIQYSGFPQYICEHPFQLAQAFQTDRWQHLCSYLNHYADLPSSTKLLVLRVLTRLSFYQTILYLEPAEPAIEGIAEDDTLAQIAYLRILSRFLLQTADIDTPYRINDMELIATNARTKGMARALSLYHMVMQHVKFYHDPAAVDYWLPRYYQAIQDIQSEVDPFTAQQHLSRYHRVAGFVPQMRQDKEGVIREMDLAEHYATTLPRTDHFQQKAADEALYGVLESRTKESMWMGDLERAETYAQRLVNINPVSLITRLELGNVLIEREKYEDAAREYRTAIMVGSHKTEIAHFMLGQCYEALDHPEMARDEYLSALKLDPLGLSAAERLVDVAEQLGDTVLLQWSRERYRTLKTQSTDESEHATYQNLPPPLPA